MEMTERCSKDGFQTSVHKPVQRLERLGHALQSLGRLRAGKSSSGAVFPLLTLRSWGLMLSAGPRLHGRTRRNQIR